MDFIAGNPIEPFAIHPLALALAVGLVLLLVFFFRFGKYGMEKIKWNKKRSIVEVKMNSRANKDPSKFIKPYVRSFWIEFLFDTFPPQVKREWGPAYRC